MKSIPPSIHSAHIIYREMQLFLIGYIIIEICEIFTVGKFPLDSTVTKVSLRPDFGQSWRLTRDRHSPVSTWE